MGTRVRCGEPVRFDPTPAERERLRGTTYHVGQEYHHEKRDGQYERVACVCDRIAGHPGPHLCKCSSSMGSVGS